MILISTFEHNKLQTFRGHPFLKSTHVVSCFNLVSLEKPARTIYYASFKKSTENCSISLQKNGDQYNLVQDLFKLMSGNYNFVENWESDEINHPEYILHGRRIPSKETSRYFIEGVCQ